MSYLVSVDVGGTFTDCVVLDEEGKVTFGKSPSTPPNFSTGILNSVRVTAEDMGMGLKDLLGNTALFFHGTTVATNTMVSHTGAKVGLITTRGFEDTLLMMRIKGRYVGLGEEYLKHMNKSNKPPQLVPKPFIKGVVERIDYKGAVVIPLDVDSVRQGVKDLVDKGAESIAVSLLWSPVNPSHEREIQNIIQEMYPEVLVSLSSDLSPKLGEYERTSTAVINSYVGPECNLYLNSLVNELNQEGFNQRRPLIMQAHGGCLPLESAIKKPVGMISSGPVGGIIGAKFIAEQYGYKNVITTDVGGTTFDVGLIYEGLPDFAREPSVSQYSLMIPTIEITSIGAGGGSIAWIEAETNMLKVGPHSAGSVPGPVCYDKGGIDPTMTDADLVLGYLNPDYFLGGKIKLNKEKAIQAFKEKIADPLNVSVEEAAIGVYEIGNAKMADLVRNITVGRGHDPRACVMFAFGGGGPVHATEYGRETQEIIIPCTASVHSALGIMSSDVVHAYEAADPMPVPADAVKVNAIFERLETQAHKDLHQEGFGDDEITLTRHIDMRYMRQVYEVSTPVPGGKLLAETLEGVYVEFEELYERLYGKGSAYREAGMQLVNFAVYGSGRITRPVLAKHEIMPEDPSHALKGTRSAYFKERIPGEVKPVWERRFRDTDVYDFDRLGSGNVIPGPAIIETPTTTIVIADDQKGILDEYKHVVLKAKEA